MASHKLVYKYVTPDGLDIFENGLIRFTQPMGLNDPFESTPNLEDVRRYLTDLATSMCARGRSSQDDVDEIVEELRMVTSPKFADQVAEIKDRDGLEIYPFKFPPESLKEVIFGYRMEPSLQNDIAEVVRSRYQHVRLFRAALNSSEFDLDILPFSE